MKKNKELYSEYLRLIKSLKEVHTLTIDVDHEDIHTFFLDKKPLFKLFYGAFLDEELSDAIVVSFHLALSHVEVIEWFFDIIELYPDIKLYDSHMEDGNGEIFLGEDAQAVEDVYIAQEVLAEWLQAHSKKEIKEFVEAKVLGKEPNRVKTFDAKVGRDRAVLSFNKARKPENGEEFH